MTVVELDSVGHCGGLLVVSQIGRPIEFHCTAPVATNRAQQIMYGQTYNGFLVADQIGMAMVDKVKSQPTMYVTDCVDMLPITELIDAPLIFADRELDETPFDGTGLAKFKIGNKPVYCVNAKADLVPYVEACITKFASMLPLDEPFERVCQAIEEAHIGVRAA